MFSPLIDFLSVGGLFYIVSAFAPLLSLHSDIAFKFSLTLALSFLINDPHFLSSYQLFYQDFRKKAFSREKYGTLRWRYVLAAIGVPIAIIAYFAAALYLGNTKMIAFSANAMFFFVGWHYTKQSYGMLITLSAMKKIYYSDHEKKAFLLNNYIVWACSWYLINTVISDPTMAPRHFIGFDLLFFDLPQMPLYFLMALSLASTAYTAYLLIVKACDDKKFSVNGIVGYSTVYAWQILPLSHPYMYMLIPMFHSLQYLPFVLRYKLNECSAEDLASEYRKKFNLFLMTALLLGASTMYFIPYLINDHIPYDQSLYGDKLFVFMVVIFINIHHYFIDNIMWRKENKDVGTYLFAHTRQNS